MNSNAAILQLLGSSLLMGAAIALLIWGGRSWLRHRYQQDVEWMTQVLYSFNPEPADPVLRVRLMYAAFVAVLAVLIFIAPHPILAVGFWLVLLTVPRIVVQMMWNHRRKKIDEQLPATIAAMANSMRAGLSLVQALERLADQAPEPIRTDFRLMVNRYSCGASLESTIREAKQRLNLPNFNLFASALLLNREMGGNVSETLQRISSALDKLHQMRKTVEAHTSEGRTNIKVLLVAPVLLLLMLSTVDPEGVKSLFTTSEGYAVLLVAGCFIGAGVYFAAKIVQSEI